MEKSTTSRENRMLQSRENVLFSVKCMLFHMDVEMGGCRGEPGPLYNGLRGGVHVLLRQNNYYKLSSLNSTCVLWHSF